MMERRLSDYRNGIIRVIDGTAFLFPDPMHDEFRLDLIQSFPNDFTRDGFFIPDHQCRDPGTFIAIQDHMSIDFLLSSQHSLVTASIPNPKIFIPTHSIPIGSRSVSPDQEDIGREKKTSEQDAMQQHQDQLQERERNEREDRRRFVQEHLQHGKKWVHERVRKKRDE
nr:hypothetical protein [Candidatus Sigynarchaeota archaeon]